MKKQAARTIATNRSASLKHLHFTNVRIGRSDSHLMSFVLAFLAPIVSAELLLRCLLDAPFHPLLSLRNLIHWFAGCVMVFVSGLIGYVYLVETGSEE